MISRALCLRIIDLATEARLGQRLPMPVTEVARQLGYDSERGRMTIGDHLRFLKHQGLLTLTVRDTTDRFIGFGSIVRVPQRALWMAAELTSKLDGSLELRPTLEISSQTRAVALFQEKIMDQRARFDRRVEVQRAACASRPGLLLLQLEQVCLEEVANRTKAAASTVLEVFGYRDLPDDPLVQSAFGECIGGVAESNALADVERVLLEAADGVRGYLVEDVSEPLLARFIAARKVEYDNNARHLSIEISNRRRLGSAASITFVQPTFSGPTHFGASNAMDARGVGEASAAVDLVAALRDLQSELWSRSAGYGAEAEAALLAGQAAEGVKNQQPIARVMANIGQVVQTIGAAPQAYDAVRIAARLFGIELPALPTLQ